MFSICSMLTYEIICQAITLAFPCYLPDHVDRSKEASISSVRMLRVLAWKRRLSCPRLCYTPLDGVGFSKETSREREGIRDWEKERDGEANELGWEIRVVFSSVYILDDYKWTRQLA